MNKELKDYTEIELKATCYDQLAQIEVFQKNIQVINQELARRAQAPKNEDVPKVETNKVK